MQRCQVIREDHGVGPGVCGARVTHVCKDCALELCDYCKGDDTCVETGKPHALEAV